MDARFNINVFSQNQLNIVQKYLGFDSPIKRICVDYDLFLSLSSELIIDIRTKVKLYVSLPVILRHTIENVYNKIARRLSDISVDGLLVHNLDELAWSKDKFPDLDIITDSHIYIHNTEALQFLFENNESNVSEFVLSNELTKAEIRRLSEEANRHHKRVTLIGYGRIPMMISDGCLKKTYNKCDARRELSINTFIEDRYNTRFAVLTDCNICTNVIYNERPTSLLKYKDLLYRSEISTVSLNFTIEDSDETDIIIKAFCYNDSRANESINNMPTTTGHLKRGV